MSGILEACLPHVLLQMDLETGPPLLRKRPLPPNMQLQEECTYLMGGKGTLASIVKSTLAISGMTDVTATSSSS